jgi:hypothetical protein
VLLPFLIGLAQAAPAVSVSARGVFHLAPYDTAVRASVVADAGTSIVRVEIYRDGVLFHINESAPYGVTWKAEAAGNYVFTAKAIDSTGAVGESAPVTLRVNAPPQVAILAPEAGSIPGPPTSLEVTAEATDSDWDETESAPVTLQVGSGTGSSGLRFHLPGRTIGCIAAEDSDNWNNVRDFIRQTVTNTVTVNSKSRNPWAPPTEQLLRYGQIVVINSN